MKLDLPHTFDFPLMDELARHLHVTGELANKTIAWHCHLTKLTTMSAKALLFAGAELAISECNPDTTDPEAVADMLSLGAHVYTGASSCSRALEHNPDLIADTGFVLVDAYLREDAGKSRTAGRKQHDARDKIAPGGKVVAASEITTSGIIRLRALESVPLPVVNVNDGLLKSRIENFHGVGDGVVDLLRKLRAKSFSGARAAVIGYGQVGAGVAHHLRREEMLVSVVEQDSVRRLIAHFDGFAVPSLPEALEESDVIVSATGRSKLIGPDEWRHCKGEQLVINVGHHADELDILALRRICLQSKTINDFIESFEIEVGLERRTIYVVAGGSPANIVFLTGRDEPTLIHLCTEALVMAYLARNGSELPRGERPLPQEVERQAAGLALKALGL